MAKSIHKGTELSNISETWDRNERQRESGNVPGSESSTPDEAPTGNDLERLIKEEAAEYDTVNKEERVLGGDRATVNDDPGSAASDEQA